MTGPVPAEYARLIRPDGSVVVPAAVADGMLRLLVLGVTEQSRRNAGGRPSAQVLEVLHALNIAAVKADERALSANGPDMSRNGKMEVLVDGDWLTSAAVAPLLACDERSVRRACQRGRLPARKIGRQWLVHTSDLDTYRFGKAA